MGNAVVTYLCPMTSLYVYIYMYTRVYIYMYMCMYIYIYTQVSYECIYKQKIDRHIDRVAPKDTQASCVRPNWWRLGAHVAVSVIGAPRQGVYSVPIRGLLHFIQGICGGSLYDCTYKQGLL